MEPITEQTTAEPTIVVTGVPEGVVQGKNLSTNYLGLNPDTFELQIVIDEDTIKHNGLAYYVDITNLNIVSSDRGNILTYGKDLGIFLKRSTITSIVRDEISSNGGAAELPASIVTYDSETKQLMVDGVAINSELGIYSESEFR